MEKDEVKAPSNLIEIGGLWLRKSKKGETYMEGPLGNAQLVVLPNQWKNPDDKRPDYRMFVRPRPKKTTPAEKRTTDAGG